jgi:hypothetical protein
MLTPTAAASSRLAELASGLDSLNHSLSADRLLIENEPIATRPNECADTVRRSAAKPCGSELKMKDRLAARTTKASCPAAEFGSMSAESSQMARQP